MKKPKKLFKNEEISIYLMFNITLNVYETYAYIYSKFRIHLCFAKLTPKKAELIAPMILHTFKRATTIGE